MYTLDTPYTRETCTGITGQKRARKNCILSAESATVAKAFGKRESAGIIRVGIDMLLEMNYCEQLTLLGQITKDVHPEIEQTPGVCGGVACIAGTRIPVWVLVGYKQLGATDAVLLQAYPTLDAENLSHAWAYYRFHQDEIDQQIAENENEDEIDEQGMDNRKVPGS